MSQDKIGSAQQQLYAAQHAAISQQQQIKNMINAQIEQIAMMTYAQCVAQGMDPYMAAQRAIETAPILLEVLGKIKVSREKNNGGNDSEGANEGGGIVLH